MMWIPRWLGRIYCKLYAEFGPRGFSFEEALEKVGRTDREVRIFLSELRKKGFLDVFGRRGRKRVYRVANPSEVLSLAGRGIDLRVVTEPIRPVLRAYLKELFDHYGERVISIVLYGSFAAGKYGPESDIDLLLVLRDYGWREKLSFRIADELSLKQWELNRRHHRVQPYPLKPEQARYHRPIYLDMVADGVILYDEGGFIEGVLDQIRRCLAELGAKRYELPDGAWYWVLKPEVKAGEVIEI